jgi:2-polyprenyl-3-methyl-5-hydroxy-6-metoxy-1,4-benzoquinol methylase
MTIGMLQPMPQLVEAFRTGDGVPYADYGEDTREGIAAMNRVMFHNQLGSEWFPAIADVHARLSSAPAKIADIGAGTGASNIAIARTYPLASVDAFDVDQTSVARSRENIEAAGLADRVTARRVDAGSGELDGTYDLVTIFEAIHDMARPVEALASARRMLADGGSVIVADERVADRFTAPGDDVERLMYGCSITHCLAVCIAGHEQSAATGTVMRTDTLHHFATDAGFASVEVLPIENDFWRFYRLRP